MTEENKNLNPTAEGSNTASGGSNFRTKIDGEDKDFYLGYDSDIDYDFDSDSSDEERNKKMDELGKLYDEKKELKNKLEKELMGYGEWKKITKKHDELVDKIKELEKELDIYFSDSEDESENEEENSLDKGKGKELVSVRERELVKLETSLTN